MNLVFPAATSSDSSSDDLIPHLIAWLISRISSSGSSLRLSEEAILNLSHQISLVLVGAIILSSIRRVLSGVGRVKSLDYFLQLDIKAFGAATTDYKQEFRRIPHVTLACPVNGLRPASMLISMYLTPKQGVYLLSTLIQLRATFPSDLGSADNASNLFASLPEYQVFGSTFDASFLVAAIGSLVVRWIYNKVDGAEWPED